MKQRRRQLVCLLLTLVLAMSLLPTASAGSAPVSYWTDAGNYNTAWYVGHEADTTYTISTPAQLAGLAKLVSDDNRYFSGKTVNLAADIDLSGHLWVPIAQFSGIFDGQGHVIRHMTVNGNYGAAGLFGQLNPYSAISAAAVARNLGIEDSTVTTYTNGGAGGLAGSAFDCGSAAYIYNCYSTADVSAGQYAALDPLVGGYHPWYNQIDNCYGSGTCTKGTDTPSTVGAYWSYDANGTTVKTSETDKTPDELKAMTPTLNAWVGAQTDGVTYAPWYSSSANGGLPVFWVAAPVVPPLPVHFVIDASAGANGAVASSGRVGVSRNDDKTFAVTPAAGYRVLDVKVDGKSVGAVTSYTFTKVRDDHTIVASFVRASSYADVAAGYWALPGIDYMTEKGLMNGVAGDFKPNEQLTRQQLWMILARLSGVNPANMAEARAWAMSKGVTDGTRPTAPVTREQAVTSLWRYAGKNASTADLSVFSDASSVSAYAREAMAWAVENGIVNGADGALLPASRISRAQMAVIFTRYLTK